LLVDPENFRALKRHRRLHPMYKSRSGLRRRPCGLAELAFGAVMATRCTEGEAVQSGVREERHGDRRDSSTPSWRCASKMNLYAFRRGVVSSHHSSVKISSRQA
ncbi:unnamed protein product, partial [Ectocarpus sp. 12 AP-2014]